MLYNEEEVKSICEKYGIEMEVMSGYPTYMGKEMDEKFPIEEIMKHPISMDDEISYTQEVVNFSIPFNSKIDDIMYNLYDSQLKCEKKLNYKEKVMNEKIHLSISCNNKNKYAA